MRPQPTPTCKPPTGKKSRKQKKPPVDFQLPKAKNPSNAPQLPSDSGPTQTDHLPPAQPTPEAQDQSASSDTVSAVLVMEKLDSIAKDITNVNKEVKDLRASLEFSQKSIDEIRKRLGAIEEKQTKFSSLSQEVQTLKMQNRQLHEKLERLESYSRKNNLIITGLKESDGENPEQVVSQFLSTLVPGSVAVERCHRLGPSQRKGKSRPMIVRFQSYPDRKKVWEKRFQLKGKDVWLKEDFPASIEEKRQSLYPILQAAKGAGMKANLVVDKLLINGATFTVNNLDSLPKPLNPENISTIRTKKHVLFFGQHSPFSNFHRCKITMGGVVYNCAEQLYQHKKALAVGDHRAANDILVATNPAEQKRIGDRLQLPNPAWYKTDGIRLMQEAVVAKFSQNQNLKQKLLATVGLCHVECNPYGTFSGVCPDPKSDRCSFEKERSNATNTILYVAIANVCYVGNYHHT